MEIKLKHKKWRTLKQILILFWVAAVIFQPSVSENRVNSILPGSMASLEVMDMQQHQSLRVMTYNVRHARGLNGKINLQQVIDVIKQAEVDVIALQEVDRYQIRSGYQDQVKRIGEQLGMSWTFVPTIRMGYMEYGNAILSKYPIESTNVLMMPGLMEMRNVMATTIDFNAIPVRIYNTHLGLDEKERAEQMNMLLQWVHGIEGHAVLMGDFNMEKQHPIMQPLLEGWSGVEVNQPSLRSGKQVDHIYTSHPVELKRVEVIASDASDHQPVVAEWIWDDGILE